LPDAGNHATGLTRALAGHDVQLLARLRSTWVFCRGPPPPPAGPDWPAGAPRRRVILR